MSDDDESYEDNDLISHLNEVLAETSKDASLAKTAYKKLLAENQRAASINKTLDVIKPILGALKQLALFRFFITVPVGFKDKTMEIVDKTINRLEPVDFSLQSWLEVYKIFVKFNPPLSASENYVIKQCLLIKRIVLTIRHDCVFYKVVNPIPIVKGLSLRMGYNPIDDKDVPSMFYAKYGRNLHERYIPIAVSMTNISILCKTLASDRMKLVISEADLMEKLSETSKGAIDMEQNIVSPSNEYTLMLKHSASDDEILQAQSKLNELINSKKLLKPTELKEEKVIAKNNPASLFGVKARSETIDDPAIYDPIKLTSKVGQTIETAESVKAMQDKCDKISLLLEEEKRLSSKLNQTILQMKEANQTTEDDIILIKTKFATQLVDAEFNTLKLNRLIKRNTDLSLLYDNLLSDHSHLQFDIGQLRIENSKLKSQLQSSEEQLNLLMKQKDLESNYEFNQFLNQIKKGNIDKIYENLVSDTMTTFATKLGMRDFTFLLDQRQIQNFLNSLFKKELDEQTRDLREQAKNLQAENAKMTEELSKIKLLCLDTKTVSTLNKITEDKFNEINDQLNKPINRVKSLNEELHVLKLNFDSLKGKKAQVFAASTTNTITKHVNPTNLTRTQDIDETYYDEGELNRQLFEQRCSIKPYLCANEFRHYDQRMQPGEWSIQKSINIDIIAKKRKAEGLPSFYSMFAK